jgi:hypothetical protein
MVTKPKAISSTGTYAEYDSSLEAIDGIPVKRGRQMRDDSISWGSADRYPIPGTPLPQESIMNGFSFRVDIA